MNVYMIFLIWFIIGILISVIINYIIYRYKRIKLKEFFSKIPHYSGTIEFYDGKKIKYRIPE